MENPSSNTSGATASETPVLGSAENVGPAGRRAETPWNSRDRQREFGALDADVANRAIPRPEPRRQKQTEPTPTWPIAVGIIAILGVGVGVLLHHGGGGSTAGTKAVASPASAPTQPPVVKVIKPTPAKKPVATRPIKEPVVARATATPAPSKVVAKEPVNAGTPAPRPRPPRAVIVVRATPAPHRPTKPDRPEARPRPAATKSTAPEIAVATPRPISHPHKEAAPKPQAPNLHLPSSNGDDSEINDKANKLLGGG